MLTLLLVFSNTAFAEEGKTYTYRDYFSITFPESWEVEMPQKKFGILGGKTTSRKPTIGIFVGGTGYGDIDSFMIKWGKYNLANFNEVKIFTSPVFEDIGKLTIDNRESRYLSYSIRGPNQEKLYWIYYYIFSENSWYTLYVTGDYDKLETDRKIIDEVISNIRILK